MHTSNHNNLTIQTYKRRRRRMSGLVDMWTNEVQNRNKTDKNEAIADTRKGSSELVREKYEKCVSLLSKFNKLMNYSEASVAMIVDCVSP